MGAWWQEFFHAPVDLSSLALFRILLGLLVVADALSYARTASAILDPDGMLPYETWRRGPQRLLVSVLRWLPASRRSVAVVIAVYGVAGACLSVGLATRLAAALVFLAGISLHHRNRHVLNAGDALVRVLTLLLVFSDAGSVWSLDALLSNSLRSSAETGSPWALRLMQLQVAALYLNAVRFKWRGQGWRRGTATHYATNLLAHRRRRLPAALDGLVAHRAATYGTLVAEVAGGVLVWFQPTRFWALGGLVLLHLGLLSLMRMHLFQWFMLASLVLFVPGEVTASLLGWSS